MAIMASTSQAEEVEPVPKPVPLAQYWRSLAPVTVTEERFFLKGEGEGERGRKGEREGMTERWGKKGKERDEKRTRRERERERERGAWRETWEGK